MSSKLIIFLIISTSFFFGACSSPDKIQTKTVTKARYEPPILEDIRGGYCNYNRKTVIININEGKGTLVICEDNTILKYVNISSGRPDGIHNTIRGEYFVGRKYRKYDSKKFPSTDGSRNMDYAHFFHEGFAFHKGNIRGYSHGCVRLRESDAEWIYNWSSIGTKVIIQTMPG